MNALYGGLVTWLVTLVLVEGFVFEGWRSWLRGRTIAALDRAAEAKQAVLRHKPDHRIIVTGEVAAEQGRQLDARLSRERKADRRAMRWHKVSYLFHCQLCLGVWVGWAAALLIPGPLPHFLLNGLLYKAVGHLLLEVAGLLKRVAQPPPHAHGIPDIEDGYE